VIWRMFCRRLLEGAAVALMAVVLLVLPMAVQAAAEAYLGQMPPGSAPRLFAPGIVSVAANFEHSAAVFSPDGRELFWCTNVNHRTDPPGEGLRLYQMRLLGGAWTEPEIASFTQGIGVPVERPVFSPDGERLFIEFSRDPNAESDTQIYVVGREGEGWSEPAPVSPRINSRAYERIHCITPDGSMIFSRDLMTAREKVFMSRWVDGAFAEPEQLGAPFDSDAHELAIVMAPDEAFLLVALTRTGREDELYISYREPDGGWTERIRTPYQCGGFLALSPDGAYLFFLGEGIYWVDTSFVDRLRPEHLR